jgi:broad specificity phosphatase PhoE
MLRARQTGKIINEMIPVPVHRSTLINEVECQYDGQPLSVVEAIDWDIYTGAPPEYEQPPEVVTRLQRFLERTCRRHPGQRIAAVTHAHLLSFAVIWAKGQTDFHYFKERLDELGIADPFPMPASVVTLTFAPSASLPHIAYTHPHTEKVGA